MNLNIRERCQKVVEYVKINKPATLAEIATATGLSNSSVYRHQKAVTRRAQYPESSWWETQRGAQWLKRLVIGVVYHFGIKQGVGAESLSAFWKAVHLETHVGSSATAMRKLKRQLSEAIVEYEAEQAEQCEAKPGQGLWLGADETFFDLPILVLMD